MYEVLSGYEESAIDTMYQYLLRNRSGYDSLRAHSLPIETFPALLFNPHPRGFEVPEGSDEVSIPLPKNIERPLTEEALAYSSITQLAGLLRSGQLTSLELTQLYIDRLKKYNPILKCAITIIEEEAIVKARLADKELKDGLDRGLLHGIPFGTKDLMSVAGYPTTWGAAPYRDQEIAHTATVIRRLENAGAILIAKLTSGALARGDVWFGGKTRNPWDTEQGASGSSAGSASATSAGLVAFSLGTETLGSITSPSNRNGVSGHRPTYGRVSRDGVMSLSWSMDKVGPICRSAQDCAIVFDAIEGKDSLDQTTVEAPFSFDNSLDISELRIGYLKRLIDRDTTAAGDNIRTAIKVLEDQGVAPDSIALPDDYPYAAFDIILRTESGAFFDELVRSGGVDMMVEQGQRSRANSLRQSRFIPAVEYIQANRYRTRLIEEMNELFSNYDVIITMTFGRNQLLITNLTGQPVVTVPVGLDDEGHPTSISFLGNIYDDGVILSFAHAFQKLTNHHEQHPEDFKK